MMAYVRAPHKGLLERLEIFRKDTTRRTVGRSLIVFECPIQICDQHIPEYGCADAGLLTQLHFLIDVDFDFIDFRSVVERDLLRSADAMGTHAVCRPRTTEEEQMGAKIYEFLCQEILRGTKSLTKILSSYPGHKVPVSMATGVDLIRGLDNAPVLSMKFIFSIISTDCHLQQMIKDCVELGWSDKQSGFVKMIVTVDAKSIALTFDKKKQLYYGFDSSLTDVGARLMVVDEDELSELIEFLEQVVLFSEDHVRRQTVAVVAKNKRKAVNMRSFVSASFETSPSISDDESMDSQTEDSESRSSGSVDLAGNSNCRSSDDFSSESSDDDPSQLLCIDWTNSNASFYPQIVQANRTSDDFVSCTKCPRRVLSGRSNIVHNWLAGRKQTD